MYIVLYLTVVLCVSVILCLIALATFTIFSHVRKSSTSANDYSLSHGIRISSYVALSAGVPQVADTLKQSNATSSVILSDAYYAATTILDRTNLESFIPLPQLNSVVAGILAISKNIEQAASNKKDAENLIKRLQSLVNSFTQPCDETESQRRRLLIIKFSQIFLELDEIIKQGKLHALIKNADQARHISGLVKDIGVAIMDYQTALQQGVYDKSFKMIETNDRILLNQLQRADDAEYSAVRDRKECLYGTRTGILQSIEDWVEDPHAARAYWLNGMAGTGKTTIAQSIASRMFALGMLGGSFFASRDVMDRSDLRLIFPTLAYQLACHFPQFRSHLITVLKSSLNIASFSLSDQFLKLLVGPLQKSKLKTLIIIDALDECRDHKPASAILFILSQHIDELPLVKFFITGRPEPRIETGFLLRSLKPHTEMKILDAVDSISVDEDITRFFKVSFSELVETRTDLELEEGWPGGKAIATLVRKSEQLFIYAVTTFRFIDSEYESPPRLLKQILDLPDGSKEALRLVDPLYSTILEVGFENVTATRETVVFGQFKAVVGSIVLLFDPLSINALHPLLDLEPSDISTSLRFLHSLLLVPENHDLLVRIIHKSFPDYITDAERCVNKFYIDPATQHARLALFCLDLMKKKLRRNLCELPPYVMNAGVGDLPARKERFVGNTLEYACKFWAKHLGMATTIDPDLITKIITSLKTFFNSNSLLWLEIISIMGNLRLAVQALLDIQQWLRDVDCVNKELCNSVEDFKRFLLYFYDGIQASSQHIYHSALPFCPLSSLTRSLYQKLACEKVKIGTGIEDEWHFDCIRSIGFEEIGALAVSRKGDLLAVGDGSGSCHVLDAASGSVVTVLKGEGFIESVAFSEDDCFVACGYTGNIMIWDIQTGIARALFWGEDKIVWSVSFSPKGTLLASGIEDGKVRIFDVESKEPLKHELEGHSLWVKSVCWSHDGSKVASGSGDKWMKIWDASTGECLHSIWVGDSIRHVAWSADGSKIASSMYGRFRIYDAQTYELLIEFEPGERSLQPINFSPEGDRLIYGSGYSVFIRDLTRNTDVSRFDGHSYEVNSVVYSPSRTSVISTDSKVLRIWALDSERTAPGPEPDTSRFLKEVLFSPNGQLLATAPYNELEVNLLDATTFSHIDTLFLDEETRSRGRYLAFTSDSTLIACGCNDWIRIWNVDTRDVVSNFHSDSHSDHLCFSPDGERIATWGEFCPVQLLDVRQGKLIAKYASEYGEDVTFFEDGSGVQYTPRSEPAIMLDIVPSAGSSDLPYEFVPSSQQKPLVQHVSASYMFADGFDWVLDSKNQRRFWIPPDRRIDSSGFQWTTTRGQKFVWSSNKGLVGIDFSDVSMDADTYVDIH